MALIGREEHVRIERKPTGIFDRRGSMYESPSKVAKE